MVDGQENDRVYDYCDSTNETNANAIGLTHMQKIKSTLLRYV